MTEEDLRLAAESAAKNALLEIRVDDRGLREVSLDQKDAWLVLAARYEGLRGLHPKAEPQADEAEKRAKEIRDELARLEKLKVEVLDKAAAWWKKAGDDVRAARTEKRFGDAIRLAAAAVASPEFQQYLPHLPPTAKSELEGTADRCYTDAGESLSTMLRDAENGIAAGGAAVWMTKVEEWEKSLRGQEIADPRFAGLAEQARTWRENKAEDIQAKLGEALTADKNAWIEAYRRVRHIPRAGDAADDGGPVFSYRFADAAKELRTAAGSFATWIYKDRAEAKARQLETHQSEWDRFLRLLGEKKVWAPNEDIKGLPGVAPGTKSAIDPDRPPTAGEFYFVSSILGGYTKKTLSWADFTPKELGTIFVLPKADKLPPDLALGLAAVFAELGEGDAAATLLDRGKGTIADTGWLRAEIAAIQGFEALVANRENEPAQVIRTADNWRIGHLRTDFFLLVDGRAAADVPQLVPDEDAVRFVERWGARPPAAPGNGK